MNTKHFKGMLAAVMACAAVGSPWAVAQAAAQQQIELFHRLPDTKATAVKELVERFNAQAKGVKVVLSDAIERSGSPHLLILEGEDEKAFVAGKPRYKPLHAPSKEAKVPLQTLRPPAMMTRAPVDAKGQLLALPVGLSTPVLFLNRDALRKSGRQSRYRAGRDLVRAPGNARPTSPTLAIAIFYTVAEPSR